MQEFKVHSLETAPEKSKPALRRLKESIGLIPNLAGAMSNSSVLIEAFEAVRSIFHKGTFSPAEREVLSLTNAAENGCPYCVAIHTMFAKKVGVDSVVIEAIRDGRVPDHPRQGPLSTFTRQLIQRRGHLENGDMRAFLKAGFTADQALEVLVGLASSTIANYGHHLTEAPLDEALRAHAWVPPNLRTP